MFHVQIYHPFSISEGTENMNQGLNTPITWWSTVGNTSGLRTDIHTILHHMVQMLSKLQIFIQIMYVFSSPNCRNT